VFCSWSAAAGRIAIVEKKLDGITQKTASRHGSGRKGE
jgi:hypothetical protein